MTPDQLALVDAVRGVFGALTSVEFPEVWGPRVVVKATTSAGVVFAKATGDVDVRAEVTALGLAHGAGVPVPKVLAMHADARVPGGRWFAMSAIDGVEWAAEDRQFAARTLPDVARCLARLHRVELAGFGSLEQTGSGEYDSWPAWMLETARGRLNRLVESGDATPAFRAEALEAFANTTPPIEHGSLIHADLTGSETLLDPEGGTVAGIVDWGAAVVADPVYEFATLQAGGPADDPAPGLVLPAILNYYVAESGMDRARIDRTLPLYRAHQAIGNADWCRREGIPWAEGLLIAANGWLQGS